MALVPRKTCGAVPGDSADKVVVLLPRFASGVLGRFLQPRLKETKKFIRIPLEERGSFLWMNMDGRRTVGDLAAAFGENFPGEEESVPERVATYLYQMSENNLIDFVNLDI